MTAGEGRQTTGVAGGYPPEESTTTGGARGRGSGTAALTVGIVVIAIAFGSFSPPSLTQRGPSWGRPSSRLPTSLTGSRADR